MAGRVQAGTKLNAGAPAAALSQQNGCDAMRATFATIASLFCVVAVDAACRRVVARHEQHDGGGSPDGLSSTRITLD